MTFETREAKGRYPSLSCSQGLVFGASSEKVAPGGKAIGVVTSVTKRSSVRAALEAAARLCGFAYRLKVDQYVSDDKPKWDMPTNVVSFKLDQAGELAKKYGISPDRAQMIIDRYGEDQEQLDKAAKGARINPK